MRWNELRTIGLEPVGKKRLPKPKSDKPPRQSDQPRQKPGPKPKLIHGTVPMYRVHGCRCELCRVVQRDKLREYRQKWSGNSGANKRSERPRATKRESIPEIATPTSSVCYNGPDWTTQEYHPLPNTGAPLEKHEPNFPEGTFACPDCSTQLRTEIEVCWFCGHVFVEPKKGPFRFNYMSARQLDWRLNSSANSNRRG